MKTLFKIMGGLVLLIVAVVIAAPMVIDPNDYREQIQTAVKEKTGRDLSIKGDLSLSVFPWVGIGINNVSLSNADGFKPDNFAEIKQANVKVKLLPLFSQQIEVSTVVLNGLQLNLAKDKSGKTNWDDMAEPSRGSQEKTTEKDSDSSGAAIGAIAIGGLQIIDANITWDDASKGEKYSLIDLDLSTDALSLGNPMGVNLAFTVDSKKPKATVRLKLKGDLIINTALNKFDFQGLTIAIDAAGDPVPNGAMKIDIASHMIADLAGSGSLTLNPVTIKFDDSTLSGNVSVNNFGKPAIGFDLAIDTINIDRYLPKTAEQASGEKVEGVAVPPPAAAAMIPVQTIRDLNIDGQLKVGSLIVNGLTAEEASVKVVAKNGVLRTEQGVKKFYNGSYAGSTTVDARQNTPRITVKEEATGINIEPLLIDLLGEASISGVANISANLTTRGNSVPAFKSALNGTAQFSFKDGAVIGVDVGALMKQADAVLKGDFSALAQKGEGKTPFTDLSGSAKITNGLVNNQDLIVATPLVNVNGAGTANLVNEKLNYRLEIQRTKALSDADKKDLKNITLPVNIKGTFAEPSIQLDVKAIVLATQQEKIEEKTQEIKEKINKKIDEKLKGKVGDLLKGLF